MNRRKVLAKTYALLNVLEKDEKNHRERFRQAERTRDHYEPDFESAFSEWWAEVKAQVNDAFSNGASYADIKTLVESSLATEPLLKRYLPIIKSLLDDLKTAYDNEFSVTIAWDKVSDVTLDSLTDAVNKYFGDFAAEQQSRILSILRDGLAQGLPSRVTAKTLAEGMESVVYHDSGGKVIKTLSSDVWANQVARTEANRAYMTATKATLQDIGMTTWQWIAADDQRTCPECESNDGEIVAIGDAFPSGDTEPPIHGSDRCTCIAVSSELREVE